MTIATKAAIKANFETEEWRPIPGFAPYEASADGGIRNGVSRKVLRPVWLGPKRCQYLAVYVGGGRGATKQFVHRLVALTFLESRPGALMACHRDGDRANNRVSNLYWGTPSENTADSLRHGTFVPMRGEANGHSRLDETKVLDLRRRRHAGETLAAIADDLGVSLSTVQLAAVGKTWAHVGGTQ